MANKKDKKIKKVTTKKTSKAIKNGAKKVVGKVVEIEETEIDIDPISPKNKKPLEIDAADILPEVEEEVAALVVEDEESEDGPSLDSEDLNPFGDKWEM